LKGDDRVMSAGQTAEDVAAARPSWDPLVLRLASERKPKPSICVRPSANAPAPQVLVPRCGVPNIGRIDGGDPMVRAHPRRDPTGQYVHQALTEGDLEIA
jgi:hypothetical protein